VYGVCYRIYALKKHYLSKNTAFLKQVICEGAGELDKAREPADRTRLKAEDSTKEREKFVLKT
jgi:hypothetical protein